MSASRKLKSEGGTDSNPGIPSSGLVAATNAATNFIINIFKDVFIFVRKAGLQEEGGMEKELSSADCGWS